MAPSRSRLLALAIAVIALVISAAAARAAPRDGAPVLEVYEKPGCTFCARAGDYLEDLQARRPELRVVVHDVTADPAARERLHQLATRHGTIMAVPAFVVGDRLLVGFDGSATTGAVIERWLDEHHGAVEVVEVPLFGTLRVDELGLPVFAIALGLVDGFNPCAMWVLLFLLSLLVNLRSRRRMALIASTFVVVSAVAYYVFMAAWLGLFLVLGVSRWLQATLGLIAIAAGAIHVKDFIAPHHGPSLSIPQRAKPRIYARVRRIVYAENLVGALAATFALAVMVNLVELLCTAGLPALFTQILSAHGLGWWEHHVYLLLYVVAYMLDDAVMVALAVITLSRRKVQERAGRALKLVSGAVMIALGALLVLRPEWLSFR